MRFGSWQAEIMLGFVAVALVREAMAAKALAISSFNSIEAWRAAILLFIAKAARDQI